MKKLVVAAAILFAAPLAARADIGLRLGADATIAYHQPNQGTTVITETWPIGFDVMLKNYGNTHCVGGSGPIGIVFRILPPSSITYRWLASRLCSVSFAPSQNRSVPVGLR